MRDLTTLTTPALTATLHRLTARWMRAHAVGHRPHAHALAADRVALETELLRRAALVRLDAAHAA